MFTTFVVKTSKRSNHVCSAANLKLANIHYCVCDPRLIHASYFLNVSCVTFFDIKMTEHKM